MSDEHVAKRLARSVLSVRARRRQIGIPNRFSKVPTWSKDEDKQLGTLPDQEIAKVLKRNLPAVRHRRWFLGIPPSRPARNLRPRDSDS